MESKDQELQKPTNYVEIEATEYMSPGQNLYDQAPFINTIVETEINEETVLKAIRISLTLYANEQENEKPNESYLWYWVTHEGLRKAHTKINKEKLATFQGILKTVISKLDQYPNWKEYIQANMSNKLYTDAFFEHGKPKGLLLGDIGPGKTYPAWLAEKEAIEKNEKTLFYWE